ncbi:MAG: hypothetical protein ACPGQI_08635, partial [Gammaproteobacteria bacterium]
MPQRQRHPRAHSACPHDCPSTCALDVEVIDGKTIGRVYGAKDNDYTGGLAGNLEPIALGANAGWSGDGTVDPLYGACSGLL